MTALALDIGGTKFAAAAVEPDGTITARTEIPLTTEQHPTDTLTTAVARILDRVPEQRISGAGIGSAGPLDPVAGTVSPLNIPHWRGHAIVDQVSALLPGRRVLLAGDAQCMALGEWWRAPLEPAAACAVLGMVVSTGVGGGLVLDGRPWTGPTGNAGHIGHITLDPDGTLCPCGARGCVETLASGPSMVRRARHNGWQGTDARQLAADARIGHPAAREAFETAAEALATAIVTTSALIDLDRVVIGGGVAAAGPVLFDPLRRAIARHGGMPFTRRATIHPTALGRDAGLLGAAALLR